MPQLVFSDASFWSDFQPLTSTRPIATMRMGIFTFQERWEQILGHSSTSYFLTEDYLQCQFPKPNDEESLVLVPNFLPNPEVIHQIKNLKLGECLVYKDEVIASYINLKNFTIGAIEKCIDVQTELCFISKPWDLFRYNHLAIAWDMDWVKSQGSSQDLSATNRVIGDKDLVFLEQGAVVECAILNTTSGPIYIGKNAEIMEGSMIRGALALCEGSKLNMGSKVYGATTIGPYCKVGGEVNNSLIFGFSNKGHEGFLGNSIIGEWCNLGADTNTSNLKNNYAFVKIWSMAQKKFVQTGLQFCGLIMGDHSKTAINTQLNTGTVVGVSAHIFREGFAPNFVKPFSWGGASNDEVFKIEKAYEVAQRAMERREKTLSEGEKNILKHLFEIQTN